MLPQPCTDQLSPPKAAEIQKAYRDAHGQRVATLSKRHGEHSLRGAGSGKKARVAATRDLYTLPFNSCTVLGNTNSRLQDSSSSSIVPGNGPDTCMYSDQDCNRPELSDRMKAMLARVQAKRARALLDQSDFNAAKSKRSRIGESIN